MREAVVRSILLYLMLSIGAFSAGNAEVTLDGEEVVFIHRAPKGRSVFLVGDFNGWNPTIDRMIYQDGSYRVRLFLLPNRYSYSFVVDEERVVDRDNPARDSEGNSIFYFVETDGAYNLYFELSEESGREGVISAVGARLECYGLSDDLEGEMALTASIDSEIEEDVILRAAVSYTGEEEPFLLRSEAISSRGEWTVRGFYRTGDIGLGDPLGMIGQDSPYDYQLSLFSRGVWLQKGSEGFISGAVFVAERLEGYRSGLESGSGGLGRDLLVKDRDPAGDEIIGGKLGINIGNALFRYLFRAGRGETGVIVPEGETARGVEDISINGGWIEYRFTEESAVEVQYLGGSATFAAYDQSAEAEGWPASENVLQDGWKLHARFRTELGGLDWNISLGREELTNYGSGRLEDPDRKMNTGALKVCKRGKGYNFGLECSAELYDNAKGYDFRLRRGNFLLDWDRVRYFDLPLINTAGIVELYTYIAEEADSGSAAFYGGDRLTVKLSTEADRISNSAIELRAVKSISLAPITPGSIREKIGSIDLLADIRGVVYNYSGFREEFTDIFLALKKEFGSSAWIMAGAGFNPYRIDRWKFRMVSEGRELYIEDRGILRAASGIDIPEVFEKLKDVEKDISSDLSFSVRAGFSF